VLYLPLVVIVVLMIGPKAFPAWFPDPRLPLTFLIAASRACFRGGGSESCGRRARA